MKEIESDDFFVPRRLNPSHFLIHLVEHFYSYFQQPVEQQLVR